MISSAINVPIIGQIDTHQQYCDLFSCFLAYSKDSQCYLFVYLYYTLCTLFVLCRQGGLLLLANCVYRKEKFLFSEQFLIGPQQVQVRHNKSIEFFR